MIYGIQEGTGKKIYRSCRDLLQESIIVLLPSFSIRSRSRKKRKKKNFYHSLLFSRTKNVSRLCYRDSTGFEWGVCCLSSVNIFLKKKATRCQIARGLERWFASRAMEYKFEPRFVPVSGSYPLPDNLARSRRFKKTNTFYSESVSTVDRTTKISNNSNGEN